MDIKKFLMGLWSEQLEGLALAEAEKKAGAILAGMWTKNAAAIAEGVKKKGDSSIREIVYQLWARGTTPKLGGALGNWIRDKQEEKIVAVCAPLVTEDMSEPERVAVVSQAVRELVF